MQVKAYHGTKNSYFIGRFDTPAYFSNSYRVSKGFALNFGAEFETVLNEPAPIVIEVNGLEFVLPVNECSNIYSDIVYQLDCLPIAIEDDDINEYIDLEAMYRILVLDIGIKRVVFKEREILEFDEFGVTQKTLETDNYIEIDAKGKTWDTDIHCEIMNHKEYDLVIVNNIVEGGIAFPDIEPTITYVVFNSEIIK